VAGKLKMFIVCDQNNIVQDIASEQVNLARGYAFPGYKLHADVKVQDVRIGDTFKDGVLTKNQMLRQKNIDRAANEQKIADKIRKKAISELIGNGDLPAGYK